MKRIKRESKIVLASLAGIFAVCTLIAAVPGIFSSVNSTNGYQVAGSAGLSGQALCSNGTYYNTPCSLANPFYQTLQANGTNQPQEPAINFSPNFTLSDNSGVATNVTLANFIARTCNSNGCYEEINGTFHEWGVTPQFDTGPQTITLPHTMATALENVVLSQCFDTSGGCNGTTTTREWAAGNFTTSSFDARNDGTGAAFWDAWGH